MPVCPACETDFEVLDGEDLDVDDSFQCDHCGELLIVTSIEPLVLEIEAEDEGDEEDEDEEEDDDEDEDEAEDDDDEEDEEDEGV